MTSSFADGHHLDEFQRQSVRFAFEVHPTEIAFDYYLHSIFWKSSITTRRSA